MTEKQSSFLKSLSIQKNQTIPSQDLSIEDASKLIGEWIKLPTIKSVYLPQITDGMYRFDNYIVKVQKAVHGSGNLYAKKLNPSTKQFEYVPGLVSKLDPSDKMTLDEAKHFGKLYGVCCCCGRTLTDEFSIENGIGPICSAKYF